MDVGSLIDPISAAIVVGGTLLATILRSGITDCRATIAALTGLRHRRFDAKRARAELSVQIREIQQDGLLRAAPHHFGDSEFDEVTDAIIGDRSLAGLHKSHEVHKRKRLEDSNRAVRALAQAAELAPVFGLAGTLLSLSQLPAQGISAQDYAGAVSMAVQTTLYGLLLGNLVFAPLSRMVERAALAEERERQELVTWLAEQIAPAMPRHKPVVLAEAV